MGPPFLLLHHTPTATDAQAADLIAGKMYVNVHTDANKGGECE